MSFFDGVYILLSFFIFIIIISCAFWMWSVFSPSFMVGTPTDFNTTMSDVMNRNFTFWDTSFAAMFIIMLLLSVVLSIFVYSHPVFILLWLLFNIICLFMWDYLTTILTAFQATSINIGQMATAIGFFQSSVPKILIAFNVLVAIAMMGKRLMK